MERRDQGLLGEVEFPQIDWGELMASTSTSKQPPHSGSQYFNNKKNTFSIVLLALVGAQYRFHVIQVGDFGRTTDGGIYVSSAVVIGMERGSLKSFFQ